MLLSVIIPAHNEEKRLGATLEKIDSFLEGKGASYELIVVDDGSSDGTARVALDSKLARKGNFYLISNGDNRGKGFSVREGFKKASGDLILFTDADLSTPIEEIEKLKKEIDGGMDIAIGSRSIKGATVEVRQPLYRMLMGKTFNRFVRFFVIRGLVDTQCGFKLFTKECIKDILSELKVNGFSFDVEILYLAKRNGYGIKEVPVVWKDSKGSKVKPVYDSARMFFELLTIRMMH